MNVKKRYIASFILLACLLAVTAIACYNMQTSGSQATSAIVDVEFDDGLGKGHRTFSLVEKSTADQNRYRLMKKVWQRNRPSFVQTQKETKIPKIIHQIWLGPKRPPGFFYKI